ncbi:MAG: cyclic lactone autoinducer peptide [Anaerostipes sp.]|nr:cyclic lactone autoinducer peptide [Anaerostipes sp.]
MKRLNRIALQMSKYLCALSLVVATMSTCRDYCLIMLYQPDVPEKLKK